MRGRVREKRNIYPEKINNLEADRKTKGRSWSWDKESYLELKKKKK